MIAHPVAVHFPNPWHPTTWFTRLAALAFEVLLAATWLRTIRALPGGLARTLVTGT